MDTILTIDSAGRVVLPKPLRDRHGLSSGSELRLRDDGAEIHLCPVAGDRPLREVSGFLVYTGRSAAPSELATSELATSELEIARVRQARLRRLAGR
jgi:AbrB family looped-hinge helix DNA binding protein